MRPNNEALKEKLSVFSSEMLSILEKPENMAKGGWQNADNMTLLHYLQHEVYELYEAIINDSNINNECYDIANFAFMIRDNNNKNK